jgi:rRNA-processing protein FCF1
MNQRTKPDRVLEALKTHKILGDTCFFMDRNFTRFLSDYAGVLQQNHILIPSRVVHELRRIERLNDYRVQAAQDALASLQTAVSKGMAEIRGEASDDHTVADNVISRVVEQRIVHHSIVVLTNNGNLRDWVYAKKRSGCFSAKNSLLVIRFDPLRGAPHIWDDADGAGNGLLPTPSASPRPRLNVPQPFARAKSTASDLDTPLHAKEDVEKTGVVCLIDGRPVRLVKKLGSGGEGAVFDTDQGSFLCKVYHSNRLTIGAQQKIELMTTRKVANSAICWPLEPVVDGQGVFRGFLMPRASGEPLGHGLFIPTVWQTKRPTWTRRESVQLASRVLEQIDYLHQMRVLLGDINPMNILVQDEKTIFFVDCDSFQVEGFPCPVGSPNFVAPEIQGVDFSRFLRTEEHELFAVATLLFMIMMPGKCPYSHQGGADGAANIRKRHFPYPLGEKASAGAPEGAWRFCWSHLTRHLKEAFHQSFHADFKGQPRISVADWLRLLREYEMILNKGAAVFQGPVPQYGFDLSILPQNFRYINGKGPPLPTGGETDLQRSVRRMAASSATVKRRPATRYPAHTTPTQSYPSSTSNVEWYSNPLVWAVVAPFKALVEVLGLTVLGTISSVVPGVLFGLAQDSMIDSLKWGAMIGGVLGTLGGLGAAWGSFNKAAAGIFPAGGFGAAAGAVAVALLAGSAWWAFLGAWFGLSGGLLVWRLSIGEQKAAQYMKTWWAS